MEFDDFRNWMKATQESFPSLRTWMLKQPENGKALWKSWRQALGRVTFDAATTAIEKMLENNALQPKFGAWDQLPGIVIGIAGGSSAKPKGVKKCICGGDGVVLVGFRNRMLSFDGNELRRIEINGEMHWGPVGVACLCPVGTWMNECRQRKVDKDQGPRTMPVYDPERMTMWNGVDDVFSARLKVEREEERLASMRQATLVFEGDVDPGLDLPDFTQKVANKFSLPG